MSSIFVHKGERDARICQKNTARFAFCGLGYATWVIDNWLVYSLCLAVSTARINVYLDWRWCKQSKVQLNRKNNKQFAVKNEGALIMSCMMKWLNMVVLQWRVKGFQMLVTSYLGPCSKTSGLQWGGAIPLFTSLFQTPPLGTPGHTSHFGSAQGQIKEQSVHPISIVNYLEDCAGSTLNLANFSTLQTP